MEKRQSLRKRGVRFDTRVVLTVMESCSVGNVHTLPDVLYVREKKGALHVLGPDTYEQLKYH